MAKIKDWAQEAADEIAYEVRQGRSNKETYRAIIVKHSPFKKGAAVAYMPVPRCDQCEYWKPVFGGKTGDCSTLEILDLPAGFGCVRWEAK
jgi:hypothetical protein